MTRPNYTSHAEEIEAARRAQQDADRENAAKPHVLRKPVASPFHISGIMRKEKLRRALRDETPHFANMRDPEPQRGSVIAVVFVCLVLAVIVGLSAVFAAESLPVDLMKCLETKGNCHA